MSEINSLLIYRFGQIGDTVAALPALWHLRGQFPEAHFTLLSEVPQGGGYIPPEKVLPPNGLIQRYLKYQGSSGWGRIWAMFGTMLDLWRGRFDAMVYLLPSIRTARQRRRDELFFKLTGIPRRLGFRGFPADAQPRRADGGLETVVHEADALLQRLALDGLPEVPAGQGRMDMGITAEERQVAETWLVRNGLAGKPWFALCNGSKWESKRWPEDRYLTVLQRLAREHDLTPVIFGGREDVESGMRLIEQLGRGACSAGELQVRESAAMLQMARFYLGNDTGVMHLAAAVGTPCVGIFSSLDWPGRWSPYGPGHRVLRHEVPCAGCLSPICRHHHECLTGISADSVYAACMDVLADFRPAA